LENLKKLVCYHFSPPVPCVLMKFYDPAIP
jgi:hypothetical protein